jgi:hypothetical protein
MEFLCDFIYVYYFLAQNNEKISKAKNYFEGNDDLFSSPKLTEMFSFMTNANFMITNSISCKFYGAQIALNINLFQMNIEVT